MKNASHHYCLIFHLYCYNKTLIMASLYHNIIINDNTQDLNQCLKCDINCSFWNIFPQAFYFILFDTQKD